MPRLSKIGAAALAAFGWTSGSAVSASYLVVAGGGGGGKRVAGAGGAGGLLTGTASLNPTLSYTITVGAGGAGSSNYNSAGTNGSDSIFNTATSIGGGGGAGSGIKNGVSGGSGGGSSDVGTVGTGTVGQGNNGGVGSGNSPNYGGGGGGGASAVGGNGSSTVAGSGGAGTASSISGSSVTYAGGGGGGSNGGTAGTGGSGGGGAGTTSDSTATAGTANLGGGGGGCGGLSTATGTTFGGQGGSGIVIISYVGAQQFSGGVVTSSGGNTIHTFTTSGTLGPVTPLSANYLVVAGGGSGGGNGYTGGGGAGGLLSGSGLTIDPYSTYIVSVGAGGASATYQLKGNQGTNSSFSAYATTAVGGGGGAGYDSAQSATSGGSGGGGTYPSNVTGGAATSGQGNAGGTATGTGGVFGAGGGGAGAVGATGSGSSNATSTGGNGGIGVASSISGTSTYYAGGGGGGTYHTGGPAGSGGLGGGGAGSKTTGAIGTAGTANTGGGGGGSCDGVNGVTASATGGSGVVIISYAGSTQLMAGGVVTIAGGNVIHTFNSSGYLTPLTLLTRSLRFRSSASAYLSRTPATAGNRRTFTWSAWVKRGSLTSYQRLFDAGASNDSFFFYNNDTLKFWLNGTAGADLQTTQVFRDPSAWYHIIIAVDTTQATSSNRLKLYINGVQVTSFSTAAYPTQNYDCVYYNTVVQHDISAYGSGTQPFDGYMAEVNFIDGQALAPTAFGTVNSYGVWQPITYGGSYGTNGFRLPFTNNASTTTLGYDFSPQGNNWTTNNISVTAGSTYDSMTDVPTLTSATAANFATLNPLSNSSTNTLSNANLTYSIAANQDGYPTSTIQFSADKYYWECTVTSTHNLVGITLGTTGITTQLALAGYGYYAVTGNKYVNGTASAYGSSFTTGDVIGVAVDMTALTITFYKNNTSQGSISIAAGLYKIAGGNGNSGGVASGSYNFGQRPFSYTPPTGYLALNTFNL